jgi:phosphoenolpyruvate synthase/pyruvate phosphate dikinase
MGTDEHAAVVAGGDLTGIVTFRPDCYVLGLQEIDKTPIAVVGGKGAHLGELSRIEGIRVPPGFCVTTNAFRRIMGEAPSIDDLLDRLSRLNVGDREAIRKLSAEIRRPLDGIAIPDDVAAAITRALARLGEPPTPSDRVRRQRTCRRPPSQVSTTRT